MTTISVRDDLLTLEQCAVMIGGSRRQIECLVRAGHLSLIRISRRCVRIARADLQTYIAQKTDR